MTDEQVHKEVITVRDMYRTDTTPEQWGNMILGLGHNLSNEQLSDRATMILKSTLLETSWRFALVQESRRFRRKP